MGENDTDESGRGRSREFRPAVEKIAILAPNRGPFVGLQGAARGFGGVPPSSPTGEPIPGEPRTRGHDKIVDPFDDQALEELLESAVGEEDEPRLILMDRLLNRLRFRREV